jgi:hypothetical protein
MTRSLMGTALGALLGAACLYLAVIAGGVGHGTYFPAKALFPFTMLSVVFTPSITTPFIVLAFLQFPLYGLFLGALYRSPRFWIAVTSLSLLHVAAAVVVFTFANPSFSP